MIDIEKTIDKKLTNILKTYNNIVWIEIGVYKGESAKNVLEDLDIKKIYLIDPYIPLSYHSRYFGTDKLVNDSKETAHKNLEKFKNKIIWYEDFSENVVSMFENESIDIIYIDGNHAYESVLLDLRKYYPKLKYGGLIIGDDYHESDVKKAIDEFSKEIGIIYNTSKNKNNIICKFWFKKYNMINGYKKLSNGVIKQSKIFNEIMTYDNNYIHPYEGFGEVGIRMSYLRLGNIMGIIGKQPMEILDVGYGNGDFLRVVHNSGIKSYGSDISGYPTPKGVKFIKWEDVFNKHFDVITFFDCLEHFEDISFVKDLQCNYIVISLPWCHYHYLGDEWFENWKHRKPDEHLWHFNHNSLTNYMEENGFILVTTNNVEDVIRKPIDNEANILTGVFKKG